MSDFKNLSDLIARFVEERDWKQFHNPKDLAISIVLESSELLEHFQWKRPEETTAYLASNLEKVKDEMADVATYLFMLAHALEVDLESAILAKMKKNAQKYPVEKAKGNHTKYDQF